MTSKLIPSASLWKVNSPGTGIVLYAHPDRRCTLDCGDQLESECTTSFSIARLDGAPRYFRSMPSSSRRSLAEAAVLKTK